MAEPTIAQIFGTGATRLASGATAPSAGLFIPDTALQAAGLATPTTATAEGHLAAVVIKAESHLTQANFDANIDQSIYISKGYSSFVTRGTNNDDYRVNQLTINLATIDTNNTIDPDNY
jgi:phosphate-selective porin